MLSSFCHHVEACKIEAVDPAVLNEFSFCLEMVPLTCIEL